MTQKIDTYSEDYRIYCLALSLFQKLMVGHKFEKGFGHRKSTHTVNHDYIRRQWLENKKHSEKFRAALKFHLQNLVNKHNQGLQNGN